MNTIGNDTFAECISGDCVQCSTCHNLVFSQHRADRELERLGQSGVSQNMDARRTKAFRNSSKQGCGICAFILQVFSYFDIPHHDDDTVILRIIELGHVTIFCPVSYQTVQIYTPGCETGVDHSPHSSFINAERWAGPSSPRDSSVGGRELSHHPDSQSAYDFIESRLERCERHVLCRRLSQATPTRLIEIYPEEHDLVRLVEIEPPSSVDYIALSYCWGKSKVLRTLQGNYDNMKRGIRVSLLPKTIQDAIKVTRKLKQRYLWVDAICIIQDSASDWEYEASQMASVYQNAYLTLVTATCAAAADGFLDHPHLASENKPPYTRAWMDHHGHKTALTARIVPSTFSHTDCGDGETEIPLSLRGWTLQEDILSRRTLTYSTYELWWSCLSETSCECEVFDSIAPEDKAQSPHLRSLYSIQNSQEAFARWRVLIAEYTGRSLTNSLDKLPAVAGIAQVIQGLTKSAYIAGLWMDDLVLGLTWEPATLAHIEDSATSSATMEYQGPTFSWASIEGQVSWKIRRTETWTSSCTVLGAESHVPGRNPLGQVQSSSATLCGLLAECALQIIPADDKKWLFDYYGVASQSGKLFNFHADMSLESFDIVTNSSYRENHVRRSAYGLKNRRARAGSTVFVFHLGHFVRPAPPRRHQPRLVVVVYLVLGKRPFEADKFERLGIIGEVIGTNANEQQGLAPRESSEWLKEFTEKTITLV